MTLSGLLQSFESADCKDAATNRSRRQQLEQWILRENHKAKREAGVMPRRHEAPRVIELTTNFEQYCVGTLQAIFEQEHDTSLCVLPGSAVTESRGFVPFTCAAMASLLRLCESEDIAIAADAKVGKGAQAWNKLFVTFLLRLFAHIIYFIVRLSLYM